MLYDSYEQVIARDRPEYWWRVNVPNTAGVGSFGNSGTSLVATSPAAGVRGGPSIPGSTGGSTDTIGDSNTANVHGWTTTAQTVPGLPSTSGWTYECWLQLLAIPTASRQYTVFGRFSSFYAGFVGFTLVDADVRFNVTVSGGSNGFITDQFFAGSVAPVGSWVHCVGIARNGASQLWVNGRQYFDVQAGTPATTNPSTINLNTYTFVIGRSRIPNNAAFYSFPGYIAEPAFYAYSLSPSQIVEHYQAGLRLRRSTPRLASVLYPFPAVAPSPGGLTSIGDVTNKRIALVSDRPR